MVDISSIKVVPSELTAIDSSQCKIGLVEDVNGNRVVYKISLHFDYPPEHELDVLTVLSKYKEVCPHIPDVYGIKQMSVHPNFRSKYNANPFDITDEYPPITMDVLFMEYIDGTPYTEHLYDNTIHFNNTIFYNLVIALKCLQHTCGFTHYDFHPSNIMVKDTGKRNLVFVYVIEDNYYIVRTNGYIPMFIDFGYSHVKNPENNNFMKYILEFTDNCITPMFSNFKIDLCLLLRNIEAVANENRDHNDAIREKIKKNHPRERQDDFVPQKVPKMKNSTDPKDKKRQIFTVDHILNKLYPTHMDSIKVSKDDSIEKIVDADANSSILNVTTVLKVLLGNGVYGPCSAFGGFTNIVLNICFRLCKYTPTTNQLSWDLLKSLKSSCRAFFREFGKIESMIYNKFYTLYCLHAIIGAIIETNASNTTGVLEFNGDAQCLAVKQKLVTVFNSIQNNIWPENLDIKVMLTRFQEFIMYMEMVVNILVGKTKRYIKKHNEQNNVTVDNVLAEIYKKNGKSTHNIKTGDEVWVLDYNTNTKRVIEKYTGGTVYLQDVKKFVSDN